MHPDDDRVGACSSLDFQQALAIAIGIVGMRIHPEHSILGNGGAAHRNETGGRWVEHGHHALMTINAFRAVGGYDETFTHNEDAELDARLKAERFHIYLTAETQVTYYPRGVRSCTVLAIFQLRARPSAQFLEASQEHETSASGAGGSGARGVSTSVSAVLWDFCASGTGMGPGVPRVRSRLRREAPRCMRGRSRHRSNGDASRLVIRILCRA
jgi:hypothetical protein